MDQYRSSSHFAAVDPQRIESIDSLRGFALLCILLLHSVEHFNFTWPAEYNPSLFETLDPHVCNVAKFLFSGKAYAIFSLMFGVSFALQVDRRRSAGRSFVGRFLWRLTALLLFGYVFSLVYVGEVLSLYAVFGIGLIVLGRLRSRWLVVIATLLALQPPLIVSWLQSYYGTKFEDPSELWALWTRGYGVFAHGSLWEIVRFNAWDGHVAVWQWSNHVGRNLQMLSLFLFGVVVGRSGYFQDVAGMRLRTRRVFGASAGTMALLSLVLKWIESKVGAPSATVCSRLFDSYLGLVQAGILASTYMLAYVYFVNRYRIFGVLAHYGKMSLTNYVMQQLIGVWFFYGFGCAMYRSFGPTLSALYGLTFLVAHLWSCELWLRHFRMGPLESLWRRVTYLDFHGVFGRQVRQVGGRSSESHPQTDVCDQRAVTKVPK